MKYGGHRTPCCGRAAESVHHMHFLRVLREDWGEYQNGMYVEGGRKHLNSSLMMSLGAGALKVSGGPNAISREEVSMATLEAGTTPRAATNRHRHTE